MSISKTSMVDFRNFKNGQNGGKVNFLVNLGILLVFDPFSFTKKSINWPSLIKSKHVIVPRKSNKHIYDFHGLY
jgi:hypothetical protein